MFRIGIKGHCLNGNVIPTFNETLDNTQGVLFYKFVVRYFCNFFYLGIYMDENFVQQLEELIPDDATCISVKINIPSYDPSDNNWVPPNYSDIKKYLIDSGVEILASSTGIHLQGRKEIPHIHYHFIAEHYVAPQNPSDHRKRWLRKKDNQECRLPSGLSIKYNSLEANMPKYQFLSYPLKEGRRDIPRRYYTFNGELMSEHMINFLARVGNEIYQSQIALRLRQEKHQERRELAYTELLDMVEHLDFKSFRDLCVWFDENYLFKLDRESIPDPRNYKKNVIRIGIYKRLLTTFEI